MKALAVKVDTVNLPPIVEFLELDDKFAKGKIGFLEVGDGNRTLVDRPDAKNQLAEAFVIFVGEDAVEDTRSKAIDVQK